MSDSNCKVCHGLGYIPVEGVQGPPIATVCRCVLKKEILANCERGYPGLSQQPVVPSSPLMGKEKTNMWITASQDWLLPHLRHMAVRQSPMWSFKVASDASLMTAWLATAALQGSEILDPDVMADAASVSLTKLTLVDLVDPPDLLVIRLGVKIARNQAMPEVFYEALTLREHLGKPTWVWDQPDCRLDESHRCYSPDAVSHIRGWARLNGQDVRVDTGKVKLPNPSNDPTRALNIRDIMMGRSTR